MMVRLTVALVMVLMLASSAMALNLDELGGTEALSMLAGMLEESEEGSLNDEELVVELGEHMTTLICSCLRDDSCSDAVATICDPTGEIEMLGFLDPVAGALTDPSNAMCALGHGIAGSVPANVDPIDRPELTPEDPVLSIEAVRWAADGLNRYALTYQLIAPEGYEGYGSISYEVRRSSSSENVLDLSGLTEPEGPGDLPLAASFSSTDLYTQACISFDEVPDGLPPSLCVPIREVDA